MPTKARRHRSTANRIASVDTRERRRGTNKQRGYDHQWAQISRMKRDTSPICEVCRIEAATEVDHIKPFDGPDDPLRTDWSNLQSICKPCHRKKTHIGKNRSGLLIAVCGAPGAGKTTYVSNNAEPADLVFDLDMIAQTLNLGWRYNRDRDVEINSLLGEWREVLVKRMRSSLFTGTAWVITSSEDVAKKMMYHKDCRIVRCRRDGGKFIAETLKH